MQVVTRDLPVDSKTVAYYYFCVKRPKRGGLAIEKRSFIYVWDQKTT